MIEFNISTRQKKDFATDHVYILSCLCILIGHFATEKKPEVALSKLHIVLWALRNEKNMDLFLKAQSIKYEFIPNYQISQSLDKIVIYAIVNNFVTQVVRNNSLFLKLSKKGIDLLNKIYVENLFNVFRRRLKMIGNVPNYISERDVGLF